ncbi:MAG TPA: pilus assembly PilX N-terminal domain-containing protein [Sedimentisphaerales bacterium]|nr:pilus assembly PilX N-terminal domain-containing protein [Sedimentisphaerales bacterium]HRS10943.1 pilus assembly PilX N-terminal domain-containing protein [Sedimentisphaerales bacterium]HRV48637.1 pilus assembly PilX N-terminal domain-containing protein [Sedimentisphaerales bacterium]
MKPSLGIAISRRRGSALVLSLIFLGVFASLAVAMATLSGVNVQVANNQCQGGRALASAHSGLEILRYYLHDISLPGGAPAARLESLFHQLEDTFADLPNIDVSYQDDTIIIPQVRLNAATNTAFAAALTYGVNADGTPNYEAIDLTITGCGGRATKRVAVSYQFKEIGNPIFDYGIATRGPLMTQGNVDIETFNEKFWADIYIESFRSALALEMIGKSSIAGKVTIANGLAYVDIANSSSVYGASGAAAAQYITVGADACTFPVPNPQDFVQYIQTTFQPGDPTSNTTLANVEIPPNTNPQFTGNTTINGIMYIRQPNIVRFVGNATINGMIVAEGHLEAPSELNQVDFGGTVVSRDVSTLSEEEFGALTEEAGTFIIAPGFSVAFGGNASMINGVIAASGVRFYGHAGGTINGSIINYSDDRMELAGNTDLVFNRSGRDKIPAGFEPETTLEFTPDSYRECI